MEKDQVADLRERFEEAIARAVSAEGENFRLQKMLQAANARNTHLSNALQSLQEQLKECQSSIWMRLLKEREVQKMGGASG